MPKAVHTDEKGLYHKKGEGIDLTGRPVTLRRKVIALDSTSGVITRALLASESGALITTICAGTNNITINLPTATGNAGCWYTIINKKNTATNSDLNIQCLNNSQHFFGAGFGEENSDANVTLFSVANNKSRMFFDETDDSNNSTRVQLWCDGTDWQFAILSKVARNQFATGNPAGIHFINSPI
jgi:hypothetical protein